MFSLPDKWETDKESFSHLKRLVAVAASTILYRRYIFTCEAYNDILLERLNLKVLDNRAQIAGPKKFISWLTAAFDAIEKSYLQRMSLIIMTNDSQGQEKALTYQIGGGSRSGLPNHGEWRCLFLSKVSQAQLQDGLWRIGASHTQPQGCVEVVDFDVNPLSPYSPKRNLPRS